MKRIFLILWAGGLATGAVADATQTLTATISMTPTISPTASLTYSPSETPTPAPKFKMTSANVVAFYGGNSPDRLHDDSGHGRDLMQVGFPPWASEPVPPEGDHWLYGSITSTGACKDYYLKLTPSAWPTRDGIFVGSVFLYFFYGGKGDVRTPFFNVSDESGKHFLSLEAGMTKPVLVMEWTSPDGMERHHIPFHGMEPGGVHTAVVKCRTDSIELYLDGQSLGCHPTAAVIGVPFKSHLGVRLGLSQSTFNYLVDALGISTDPDEPWPQMQATRPPPTTPPLYPQD